MSPEKFPALGNGSDLTGVLLCVGLQIGEVTERGLSAVTDFEAFAADEGKRLTRLAFLLSGDEEDARDIVQEALARAYVNWDRVRTTDNPRAYVRRIVVNTGRTWWRRHRLYEVPSADLAARHDLAAFSPEEVADAVTVWQMCLGLPRHQRVAVVLRFYEDLSYAEIADLTDCTESTARSRVFRGLDALRLSLGEEK